MKLLTKLLAMTKYCVITNDFINEAVAVELSNSYCSYMWDIVVIISARNAEIYFNPQVISWQLGQKNKIKLCLFYNFPRHQEEL